MNKSNDLKHKWKRIINKLSTQFNDGEEINIDTIIYLIGLQELGKIESKLKKDDKLNLMHVAICKLLEPYGYYEFEHIDSEGWPHYKLISQLPNLKPGEQTILIKQAIINYFTSTNFI